MWGVHVALIGKIFCTNQGTVCPAAHWPSTSLWWPSSWQPSRCKRSWIFESWPCPSQEAKREQNKPVTRQHRHKAPPIIFIPNSTHIQPYPKLGQLWSKIVFNMLTSNIFENKCWSKLQFWTVGKAKLQNVMEETLWGNGEWNLWVMLLLSPGVLICLRAQGTLKSTNSTLWNQKNRNNELYNIETLNSAKSKIGVCKIENSNCENLSVPKQPEEKNMFDSFNRYIDSASQYNTTECRSRLRWLQNYDIPCSPLHRDS